MHSFHYRSMEHNNGLLHCSADTRHNQERIGGDVPLVWQPADGPMERFHFALVNV